MHLIRTCGFVVLAFSLAAKASRVKGTNDGSGERPTSIPTEDPSATSPRGAYHSLLMPWSRSVVPESGQLGSHCRAIAALLLVASSALIATPLKRIASHNESSLSFQYLAHGSETRRAAEFRFHRQHLAR